MEQPVPSELEAFHREDAQEILYLMRRFGWDPRDFLEHTPRLRETLEEYHGDFIDPRYPELQRANIIQYALEAYREVMRGHSPSASW